MNLRQLRKKLSAHPLTWRDCAMLFLGVVVSLAGMFTANYIQGKQTPLPYQPRGITAKWIPDSVRRWEGAINEMGKKYNVDPNLIAILMTMESGGYAKAESEAGAKG